MKWKKRKIAKLVEQSRRKTIEMRNKHVRRNIAKNKKRRKNRTMASNISDLVQPDHMP